MSLPIEFATANVENTEELVLQQPKTALNLFNANCEDSDSEELEIELSHS